MYHDISIESSWSYSVHADLCYVGTAHLGADNSNDRHSGMPLSSTNFLSLRLTYAEIATIGGYFFTYSFSTAASTCMFLTHFG